MGSQKKRRKHRFNLAGGIHSLRRKCRHLGKTVDSKANPESNEQRSLSGVMDAGPSQSCHHGDHTYHTPVSNGEASSKSHRGPSVRNRQCFRYNATFLHEAVSMGDVEIIKLLLRSDVDVNAPAKDGRTALHMAARFGHREIVEELLKAKADVNCLTKDRRSCLHIAAWRQNIQIARDLLKAGANVNIQDEDGWTPLHWCAKHALASLAKSLLCGGARLNLQDKSGRTPLHECISQGSHEMLTLLLREGADGNIASKADTSLSMLLKAKSSTEKDIRILISTGYKLSSVDSKTLTKFPGPIKGDLANWFRQHTENPSSLTHLSRLKIREILRTNHRGKAISRRLSELPVPVLLCEYLTFSKELSE